MIVTFDQEYLMELYTKGQTSDRRHRFQPQIVKKYVRTIDLMKALANVQCLAQYGGLHYEHLHGDREGLSSVRVNDQYRIEFREILEDEQQIAEVVSVRNCQIIINKGNMVHIEGVSDTMIANNLEPVYLTHPGEVLKDELEARGISQRQLAVCIGMPASQLNEMLKAKRALSAEMALLIGKALDLDPAPLLALQTKYNLLTAKRDKSILDRLKEIHKIAAAF